MKKNSDKTFFENIGGSFQFRAKNSADLRKILSLDATAWAALCVPAASLNGDPGFFKLLDTDNNGMIRVDEVKSAVKWLLDVLKDHTPIDKETAAFSSAMFNEDDADGKALKEFVLQHKAVLENSTGIVELAAVRTQLAAVRNGALSGDGLLKAKAVEGSSAAGFYKDVTAALACPDKLTIAALEKFLADAKKFVEWSKTAVKPRFRDDEPEKYYTLYQALQSKIDEYFRYCELICIDPANAARFELDPAKLPELDLKDSASVNAVLEGAPLNRPDARMVLELNAVSNPVYRKKALDFAALFGVEELTCEMWQSLKAEFADYINYLALSQNNPAPKLSVGQLEQYLEGSEADTLRARFAEDLAVAGVVADLCKLERLLLCCRYMLSFVNNFVSFAEFFDPFNSSMLQAGRLVMDGKSYHLAVWIDDAANHKKIAMRSNMCLLYLELTSGALKRKAAVAVTGGSLDRIYVGKPAYFIDNHGVSYTGKVIDMVDGPISFGQTLFAPFRRLSTAISGKIQKLTDFSAAEKQLAQSIEQGKVAPAAPPPAAPGLLQKLQGNGIMLLLAGGLSLAAIGAGLSFIFKSIVSGVATVSALPWYVILSWAAIFAAVILLPMAVFAFLRLRKRNLTMFLEAGGWAVNLPMRLSMSVSRIFTRGTEYPDGSRFTVIRRPRSKRAAWIIAFILLAVIAVAVWYIVSRGYVSLPWCCKTSCK